MKKSIDVLIWALLLFLITPSGMALASWNAVPGDVTYAWKLSLEKVLLLVLSPSDKLQSTTQVKIAERRFDEMEQVLSSEYAVEGLDNLNKQLDATSDNIQKINKNESRTEVTDQYIASLKKMSVALDEQKTKAKTGEISIVAQKSTTSSDNQAKTSSTKSIANKTTSGVTSKPATTVISNPDSDSVSEPINNDSPSDPTSVPVVNPTSVPVVNTTTVPANPTVIPTVAPKEETEEVIKEIIKTEDKIKEKIKKLEEEKKSQQNSVQSDDTKGNNERKNSNDQVKRQEIIKKSETNNDTNSKNSNSVNNARTINTRKFEMR